MGSPNLKKRIFNIIAGAHPRGTPGWYFNRFIFLVIFLNIVAFLIRFNEDIRENYRTELFIFEAVSVLIFTVEYILRVWTANYLPEYDHSKNSNLKYAFTPIAVMDLLAFLPFYLPFLGLDLRILRILRLFRIARTFYNRRKAVKEWSWFVSRLGEVAGVSGIQDVRVSAKSEDYAAAGKVFTRRALRETKAHVAWTEFIAQYPKTLRWFNINM